MKTILCIEDNPDNLKVMQLMIARLRPNDRFVSASTAEEGLLIASQLIPDIILMDINLPGMNGYEALEVLRQTNACHVPVIAISAHAMADDVRSGLTAGFDFYITKPIDMKFLQSTLEEYLPHSEVAWTG